MPSKMRALSLSLVLVSAFTATHVHGFTACSLETDESGCDEDCIWSSGACACSPGTVINRAVTSCAADNSGVPTQIELTYYAAEDTVCGGAPVNVQTGTLQDLNPLIDTSTGCASLGSISQLFTCSADGTTVEMTFFTSSGDCDGGAAGPAAAFDDAKCSCSSELPDALKCFTCAHGDPNCASEAACVSGGDGPDTCSWVTDHCQCPAQQFTQVDGCEPESDTDPSLKTITIKMYDESASDPTQERTTSPCEGTATMETTMDVAQISSFPQGCQDTGIIGMKMECVSGEIAYSTYAATDCTGTSSGTIEMPSLTQCKCADDSGDGDGDAKSGDKDDESAAHGVAASAALALLTAAAASAASGEL